MFTRKRGNLALQEGTMKIATILCYLLILGNGVMVQQETNDPYSLERVKDTMDRLSYGLIFGWDTRDIPALGDRCAIAILKIVEVPELVQPKTAEGVLRTIHLAFARPDLIRIKEDRKPKVTLFVLNYMKDKIPDPETQRKIEETIEFVRLQSHSDTAPVMPLTK